MESHLIHQVKNILGYESQQFEQALRKTIPAASERYLYCFNRKKPKHKPAHVYYHADEYASFLYFAANELWLQTRESEYAGKLYLLNRCLNSLDIFYDRKLPEIFHLEHPIGTVIGRAEIGNYFVIHQGATIGGNLDLELPVIGENVVIYTGAMVIGRCVVGDNCQIGAGVFLHNERVEGGTTIVSSGHKKIVNSRRDFKAHFFNTNP
jgi:serine O-acetyltransferase